MKRIRQWFKDLLLEHVIIEVKPTPVTVNPTPVTVTPAPVTVSTDVAAIIAALPKPEPLPPIPAPVVDVGQLVAGIAGQLESIIHGRLLDAVNAALRPRLPDQPPLQSPGNPTTEGKLLSLLPSDVQKAARYGCRHVQQESRFPVGGKVLGHNYHRDEACELAMTWLQERCIQYRSSDVHLACELYYRVYVRGQDAAGD